MNVIRKIDLSGNVTTFAGENGTPGFNDGEGTNARFSYPQGVAVDSLNSTARYKIQDHGLEFYI